MLGFCIFCLIILYFKYYIPSVATGLGSSAGALAHREDRFTASRIFKGNFPLLSLRIMQEDQVEFSYILQRSLIVSS